MCRAFKRSNLDPGGFAELAEAHAIVTAGEVVVEPLITHRLPLSEVTRGVDLMLRREAVKVLVVPEPA